MPKIRMKKQQKQITEETDDKIVHDNWWFDKYDSLIINWQMTFINGSHHKSFHYLLANL